MSHVFLCSLYLDFSICHVLFVNLPCFATHSTILRQVNYKPVAMGENYFCSSPPPPRVRTQLVHLPIQLEPKIGSSPMEVQQRKPVVVAATIQLEHKVFNCVF